MLSEVLVELKEEVEDFEAVVLDVNPVVFLFLVTPKILDVLSVVLVLVALTAEAASEFELPSEEISDESFSETVGVLMTSVFRIGLSVDCCENSTSESIFTFSIIEKKS